MGAEAKKYLQDHSIPQLFEDPDVYTQSIESMYQKFKHRHKKEYGTARSKLGLMTGLIYNKPKDPINFLESAIRRIRENPDLTLKWDSFVDFKPEAAQPSSSVDKIVTDIQEKGDKKTRGTDKLPASSSKKTKPRLDNSSSPRPSRPTDASRTKKKISTTNEHKSSKRRERKPEKRHDTERLATPEDIAEKVGQDLDRKLSNSKGLLKPKAQKEIPVSSWSKPLPSLELPAKDGVAEASSLHSGNIHKSLSVCLPDKLSSQILDRKHNTISTRGYSFRSNAPPLVISSPRSFQEKPVALKISSPKWLEPIGLPRPLVATADMNVFEAATDEYFSFNKAEPLSKIATLELQHSELKLELSDDGQGSQQKLSPVAGSFRDNSVLVFDEPIHETKGEQEEEHKKSISFR